MRRNGRRSEDNEEHLNPEGWLLPYADMITLLFILFAVLYVMSSVDVAKYESLAKSLKVGFNSSEGGETVNLDPKEADRKIQEDTVTRNEAKKERENDDGRSKAFLEEQKLMDKLEDQLTSYIKDRDLQSRVFVNRTDRGVQITFQDASLFNPASASLSKEAKDTLTGIVPFFRDLKRDILIEGHTDNVPVVGGPYRDNFHLSSERALSVLNFLQNQSVHPSRLSAQGFGEYRPVANNSSEDGKSRNRRVNITIQHQEITP